MNILAELVTEADHDAGFKDLEVEYRSGRIVSARIRALGRREVRELTEPGKDVLDPDRVTAAALPPHLPAADLDKLTIESANRVELTALALCYGVGWQKKMAALAEKLWETRTLNASGSDLNSSASAADGPPPKCEAGAVPA